MSSSEPPTFDATRHWRLSDHASLRDESFGALAYHHDTRRLMFLKSRALVELVRQLDDYASASDAISALVEEPERDLYLAALSSLCVSGLISA
ncbi:MAG TPA: mycofactocin biosynthesis chaperone MftB [Acidimicrobiales bacterium]